jgi:anti-sigma factor (TIGR02949 family)
MNVEQELKDAEPTEAALKRKAGCITADFYSCEEAVKRLNEYLDHELTPEERVVVLKHLEICRPCLKRFSFEQTLVVSLRQKVTLLCMPASLRDKLHGLLHEHDKE